MLEQVSRFEGAVSWRTMYVHQDDTPEDEEVEMEDVCYAERKAEDYAEDT